MTLLLLSSLSVLLLATTESVLLSRKAQRAFEISVENFYIAEAGLARAQALCPGLKIGPYEEEGEEGGEKNLLKKGEPEFPWGKWIPFGSGKYFLSVRSVSDLPANHPLSPMGSGVFVEVSAKMEPRNEIGIRILLEDPPSCRLLAWWQARGI